jgi:hypothetical protein
LYIQWATIVVSNTIWPDLGKDLTVGYGASSIALMIAILLLVFQRTCAFTVEIIVLLSILFGGGLVVLSRHAIAGGDAPPAEKGKLFAVKLTDIYDGLKLSYIWFFGPLCPIAAWFWIRLATVGERDFDPTPGAGGTTFFLFGKASISNSTTIKFLAAVSTWFAIEPVLAALMTFVLLCGLEYSIVPYFFFSAFALTYIVFLVIIIGIYLALILGWVVARLRFAVKIQKYDVEAIQRLAARLSKQVDEWSSKCVDREQTIVEVLAFIYTILAVELTLSWNNVTGVYSIDSVGQIIPLAGGVLNIVYAAWKINRKREDKRRYKPLTGSLQVFEDGKWL